MRFYQTEPEALEDILTPSARDEYYQLNERLIEEICELVAKKK